VLEYGETLMSASAVLFLGTLLTIAASAAETPSPMAASAYAAADEYRYKLRDYRRALDAYRGIVKEFPQSDLADDAQRMTAFVLRHDLRLYPAALRSYETLIRTFPASEYVGPSLLAIADLHERRLGRPRKALDSYLEYLRRWRAGLGEENGLSDLAKRRAEALVRNLYFGQPAPAKQSGKRHFEAAISTNEFAAAFSEGAGLDLTYRLSPAAKSFTFASRAPAAQGILFVAIGDMSNPFHVLADGDEHGNFAILRTLLAVRDIRPNRTYEVRGLGAEGRTKVRGWLTTKAFDLRFSDDRSVHVDLTYKLTRTDKSFRFRLLEGPPSVRGTLNVLIEDMTENLCVTEDGRNYRDYETEIKGHRRKVRRGFEIIERSQILMSKIDPNRTYSVSEIRAEIPGGPSEEPELTTDDLELPEKGDGE